MQFFPRVTPAVIVAVVWDRKILLAQARRFPSAFHSVLAGFVEPGETFEECVRREVREEVGIEVSNLRYFGSQPWPFPHSLMVGFTAEYAEGALAIDEKEIVRAGWFDADEIARLPIPRHGTIARRLIEWFLERRWVPLEPSEKMKPGLRKLSPTETGPEGLGIPATDKREGKMELNGKHVAVLAEDLYEDLELWYPVHRFREAGAKVTVVGGGARVYSSKHGYPVTPDATAEKVNAADFDAVIIPGGYAPDRMRRHKAMVDLVRDVFARGKVVAAICHGGWMLVSADVLRGRKATCFFAIKDDLINAGALYEDREVVRDGNLVTSRKPEDLPAFCRTILQALSGAKA
jgi:protease I